ncbi:MAG: MoaD family protein [Actinomycetota bacterium]|nr:MoaD family protein [Actinomycetota bacterium]
MAKVKLFASLRREAGVGEVEIDVDNVKDLMKKLSSLYPDAEKYLKISSVVVNGRNVINMKGGRTRLSPSDVVSIFPPMGGG